MEGNEKQKTKKNKKIPNLLKILYIMCILAAIISIIIMKYRQEKGKDESINFATNGAVGMEVDKYAFLDVDGLTGEVAIYGEINDADNPENDRYYIAFSGGYMYIVDLDFDMMKQLQAIQDYTYSEDENAVAPEAVKIYGMTESIPNELKTLVLEYYNKSMEEDKKIKEEDFEKYFGSVLLNVRREPIDTTIEETIIELAIIAFFMLIIINIAVKLTGRKNEN